MNNCNNLKLVRASRFFHFVTMYVCDGQTDRRTDRITTPKTALSLLRTVLETKYDMHMAAKCLVMALADNWWTDLRSLEISM